MSSVTINQADNHHCQLTALPGASFGGVVRSRTGAGAQQLTAAAEEHPAAFTDLLYTPTVCCFYLT